MQCRNFTTAFCCSVCGWILLQAEDVERISAMTAVLEAIDGMTTAEKVRTMDYLWTSLEASRSGYEPPAWHGRELARREKLLAEGKVPVYDWQEAKVRLTARAAALLT